MSLPTTQLANVRVVESWIDRPFTDFDDTATKVYYLRCHCAESDYTALVQGVANLTSAATAGVISTRYTDATARWVGDVDFKSSDGGYMTFVRRFANIPDDHEDYTSSVVTLPDGSISDLIRTETGRPYNIVYTGGDYQLPTRVEYTFNIDPAAIAVQTPFFVTIDVNSGDNYSDGDTVGFTLSSQTTPNTNQFYESGIERASEATQIVKWMGDIYMGITSYIIPDNIKDSTPAP